MPWLADTNTLLRFSNAGDPQHLLVRRAVGALLERGERLYYTQQNRREFWNVSTRPAAANGWGYTVAQTGHAHAEVDATFQRLPDRPETGPEWDRLVTHCQVIGVSVHDAQRVAAMIMHGMERILTLDVDHVRRYVEVEAVHPQDVPLPPTPMGNAA